MFPTPRATFITSSVHTSYKKRKGKEREGKGREGKGRERKGKEWGRRSTLNIANPKNDPGVLISEHHWVKALVI